MKYWLMIQHIHFSRCFFTSILVQFACSFTIVIPTKLSSHLVLLLLSFAKMHVLFCCCCWSGDSKTSRRIRISPPWPNDWIWHLGVRPHGLGEPVSEQWRFCPFMAGGWWFVGACFSAKAHCSTNPVDPLPRARWNRTLVSTYKRDGRCYIEGTFGCGEMRILPLW